MAHAPKPISDTFMPVLPNSRYFMSQMCSALGDELY
jgi:hypothetical protein